MEESSILHPMFYLFSQLLLTFTVQYQIVRC
uniref:Uncharacterized protein n=1 Tax=Rhizophora mucronata TaxID=61149 RepID=A0A2P2PVY1_RHIMU